MMIVEKKRCRRRLDAVRHTLSEREEMLREYLADRVENENARFHRRIYESVAAFNGAGKWDEMDRIRCDEFHWEEYIDSLLARFVTSL